MEKIWSSSSENLDNFFVGAGGFAIGLSLSFTENLSAEDVIRPLLRPLVHNRDRNRVRERRRLINRHLDHDLLHQPVCNVRIQSVLRQAHDQPTTPYHHTSIRHTCSTTMTGVTLRLGTARGAIV